MGRIIYKKMHLSKINREGIISKVKRNKESIIIISKEYGFIRKNTLNSLYLTIKKEFKTKLKLKIKIETYKNPYWNVSKKPGETKLGQGVGEIDHQLAKIIKGDILLKINVKNTKENIELLNKLHFPIKIKIL